MSYEKIANVVDSLIVNTKIGKITWKESRLEEDAFQYSTTSTSIIIRKYQANFGDVGIAIDIYDNIGKKIESVTDEELAQFFEKPYMKMDDLFSIARRQALGVEQILDNLLEELPKVPQEQSLITKAANMNRTGMDDVPF